MKIGKMRHRVEIQEKVETPDPSGLGQVASWQTKWKAWAEVIPQGPATAEPVVADQVQASSLVLVRMRWRDDFTERDAILFRGKRMNVRDIVNVESLNRVAEAMCESGVAV